MADTVKLIIYVTVAWAVRWAVLKIPAAIGGAIGEQQQTAITEALANAAFVFVIGLVEYVERKVIPVVKQKIGW